MITSGATFTSDLAEIGSPEWEPITTARLLDETGFDYSGGYREMTDLHLAEMSDSVLWVRFTHVVAKIVLAEFPRWHVCESGCVVRKYRVRAEEETHT